MVNLLKNQNMSDRDQVSKAGSSQEDVELEEEEVEDDWVIKL